MKKRKQLVNMFGYFNNNYLGICQDVVHQSYRFRKATKDDIQKRCPAAVENLWITLVYLSDDAVDWIEALLR